MSDETCGNCKHSVKHWTPDRYVCMRASDAVEFVQGDQEACSDFDPLTYGGLSGICEAFGYAIGLGVLSASAERTCRFTLEEDREMLAEKAACGPGEFVTQDMPDLLWTCSACGEQYRNGLDALPGWLKHCPNCGAKVIPC